MSLTTNKFKLNSLSLVVLSAISAPSFAAYQQGVGEFVTVEKGEYLEKVTEVKPIKKEADITGERNRDGDPVRIIWYGKPGQKGAINAGSIYGKVNVKGVASEDKDDYRSSIYTEAVGNGLDAYGWTPEDNKHEVIYELEKIINSGSINGIANLEGYAGVVHGDVSGYGSGNGISIRAVESFGKYNLGGGGSDDALSGGSGMSRSVKVRHRSRAMPIVKVASTTPAGATPKSSVTADVDVHGKDLDISLLSLVNTDTISGKITAQAAQGENITNEYNPQFYGATAASSGNGVALSSFIKTIDAFTFSEERINNVALGTVENSGIISGQANVKGGEFTTHTHTTSDSAGNGISVHAESGRRVKSSTYASIGDITNSGNIQGEVNQISGDNSGYKGVHLLSRARSYASGNGISAKASVLNGQTKMAEASIGNIINTGSIQGHTTLQAGNGTGDLTIESKGSGNGISSYLDAGSAKQQEASIGNINNSGIITGHLETHAGITSASIKEGQTIPDEEVRLTITTKESHGSYKAPDVLPDTPSEAIPINPWKPIDHIANQYTALSDIKASGNGISVYKGNPADPLNNQNVGGKLGNITNKGTISGYSKMYHGLANSEYTQVDFLGTGTGIFTDQKMQSEIKNLGIISGNHAAILARGYINDAYSVYDPKFEKGYDQQIQNYGTMAGVLIAGQYDGGKASNSTSKQRYEYYDASESPVDNQGTLIYLQEGLTKGKGWPGTPVRHEDYEKIARIEAAANSTVQIDGVDYQIINGEVDESGKDSQYIATEQQLDHHIINGAGIKNGALVVNHALNLNNSIVNGYATAVNIQGTEQVSINNTVLNANGFNANRDIKTHVILGDEQDNKVILKGETALNGNLDLKDGDDSLTIASNQVHINGQDIDLGKGNNTFILGQKAQVRYFRAAATSPIIVDYQVKNAQTLEVNNSTVITANADLKDVQNLVINDQLTYQVKDGKHHALYNPNVDHDVELSGTGTLTLDIEKPLANQELDLDLGNNRQFINNDEGLSLAVTNVMQNAYIDENGKIQIKAKEVIPEVVEPEVTEPEVVEPEVVEPEVVEPEVTEPEVTEPEVVEPEVTEPEVTEPEITKPEVTKPEKAVFVTNYADAYNSVVGAWTTNKVNLLENSASLKGKTEQQATDAINDYLNKVVNQNIYAALPSVGFDSMQNYRLISLDFASNMLKQGEVYTSASVKHSKTDYRNSINEASSNILVLNTSYGLRDDITAGFAVGMGKEKVEGYQSSKLDGDSLYVGSFINKGFQQNKLLWTTGVAYETMDLNGHRTIANGYDNHRFNSKVDSNIFSAYTQLEYKLALNENVNWAPKANIAYNNLKLDQINEMGVGSLSIDEKHYDTVDFTIGQSLQFNKVVGQGVLSTSLDMDYTHTSGLKDVKAHFNGSQHNFALNLDDDKNTFGVGTNIKYSFNSGLSFSAGLKNRFKNHNNNLQATFQTSYKF